MAAFVQLTPDTPALDSASHVLRACDYARAVEAETALEQAKQRAEEILRDAQKTYEVEKARGRAEGLAEAQGEVAAQIMTIVSRSVDYLAGAEVEVARVVLTCLRKILGEFTDDDLVVRAARAALQVVRNEPRVTLRVPADIEPSVRERVGQILSGNGEVTFLEIVGDEGMARGGCRLESEAGVVDASIEQQLQALEKTLSTRVKTPVTEQ